MKPIYSNLTCKMLALTLCSIMLAFLSIGCEHDVYNPDNGKNDEKAPNSFDFSTTLKNSFQKSEDEWERPLYFLCYLKLLLPRNHNLPLITKEVFLLKNSSINPQKIMQALILKSTSAILTSSGKGNGNSLQYSCLGNPMDRGAW